MYVRTNIFFILSIFLDFIFLFFLNFFLLMMKRHIILQSHDISHDMRSQAQSGLKQIRWMTLRNMLTMWLSYDVYMVYLWMTYEHQGRVIIKQHKLYVIYINRIAIQQRLLVEFSCGPHINSLLRALLPYMIIGLCVQWLLQQ